MYTFVISDSMEESISAKKQNIASTPFKDHKDRNVDRHSKNDEKVDVVQVFKEKSRSTFIRSHHSASYCFDLNHIFSIIIEIRSHRPLV